MPKIKKNDKEKWPFDIKKWRQSSEVKSLDLATRMIWFDILCYMWESDERGYFSINYQPIITLVPVQTATILSVQTESIVESIVATQSLFKTAIEKMYSYNVFSIREDGVIYCREMVREAKMKIYKSKGGIESYNKRVEKSLHFGIPPVQAESIVPVQAESIVPVQAPTIDASHEVFRAGARTTTTNISNNTGYNTNISSSNSVQAESIVPVQAESIVPVQAESIVPVQAESIVPVQAESIGLYNGNYKFSESNQGITHPIEVCLWNYFNNPLYSGPKSLHCVRLNLDSNPQKCENQLPAWATAFNRSLLNDGKKTMSMVGGRESWLTYFPNWAKKVIEQRGYINPDILFTEKDIKQKIKENDKQNNKKTTIKTPEEILKERGIA